MKFNGRIVLIAGASGNLGTAVASRFLSEGATLALVDRSKDRLAGLFPEAAASPDHLLVECVDMADTAAVQGAVGVILERFGRIDVFVTLVGGYRAGSPLHQTALATFDFLMNLNARTLFVGAQAVLPGMLVRGYGKIIGAGSRSGLAGSANAAAFSASKSAMIRLIESMAEEVKDSGINVNCVLPGFMDTPQNRASNPDGDPARWVSPDSVAEVIAFLASDSARDIHGASIPVFGQT